MKVKTYNIDYINTYRNKQVSGFYCSKCGDWYMTGEYYSNRWYNKVPIDKFNKKFMCDYCCSKIYGNQKITNESKYQA